MSRRLWKRWAIAFLVVVCVVGTRAADADPVVVQSGGFSGDYGDPAFPWKFAGDGFYFEMADGLSGGDVYWGFFASCFPCDAGAPVDLSTRFLAFTGSGDSTRNVYYENGVFEPARIGGATYPVLYYTGDLIIDAPTVPAGPGTAEMFWLEQPFTLRGHLTAYTNASLQGTPVFDWDLVGRGTAGVILGQDTDEQGRPTGSFRPLAWRYQFQDDAAAPVPEPSTLLLVGGALSGAAVRWRRRRSPA